MALPPYESPTFLGSKDKYLLGLSLPQLLGVVAVAFIAFLFSLLLPFGFAMKMAVTIPSTIFVSFLIFGQIAGMMVPTFVILGVASLFRHPVYEEHHHLLINGGLVWLEAMEAKRMKGRFWRRLARRPTMTDDEEMAIRAAELQAELDSQVSQGAVAAEQMVRDGVRAILKGR